MNCPKCGTPMNKNGHDRDGSQKWVCRKCKYYPKGDPKLKEEQKEPEGKTLGLTEDQFRSKYDLRFIVASKCKELKRGIYLSMYEFVKFCGITPGSGYRDLMLGPDYEPYRGKVRGEIYWSHPDSIKKMKDEGNLM
jgi:DNA-directed RNA polymerase subunit M/transcription elongation factor TFIIS